MQVLLDQAKPLPLHTKLDVHDHDYLRRPFIWIRGYAYSLGPQRRAEREARVARRARREREKEARKRARWAMEKEDAKRARWSGEQGDARAWSEDEVSLHFSDPKGRDRAGFLSFSVWFKV